MNKIIVTLLGIVVIMSAIFTAIMIFSPKDPKGIQNIETKVAEEEILDECTEEYEEMEQENSIRANTRRRKNITKLFINN